MRTGGNNDPVAAKVLVMRLTAGGLLLLMLGLGGGSAAQAAPQYRLLDTTRSRPVHGATATLGGPEGGVQAGPRFPVIPAGASVGQPGVPRQRQLKP